MSINRRHFLMFLGMSFGVSVWGISKQKLLMPFSSPSIAANSKDLSFQPLKLPMPLKIDGMTPQEQITAYSTYEVIDDLVLPQGFTYDVVAMWGDRIGNSRFGYNNDYLSFLETRPNEGYLTVNFEYISGKPWMQSFEKVIGKSLPFAEVKSATTDGNIKAFILSDNDPLKEQIKDISKEGLIDQGIGIISIRRNKEGKWQRTYNRADRRITGISGLEDGHYLKATGPAVTIFTKTNKLGYEDNLGSKIIGTFQNCAGGTTPWGTVFSAEENYQEQVPELVMADGSSSNPDTTPFTLTDEAVDGRGNVFGLAGNKYGWMVEIDPANPDDYGTKHTWLGRYRHEAVAFHAVEGEQMAVYSGCDRRGGHLYKFISEGKITQPKDRDNSKLFERGMLYGAKFNPDGSGEWIALQPSTPINPVLPSQVEGNKVPLPNPNRTEGGIVKTIDDTEVGTYKQQFKTLNDLYQGNNNEKQGAILIDAHFAANAAGVTCTARPEDTKIAPDGTLYITFTSGTPGEDGGADKQIFKSPNGDTAYEFGWIMRLTEDNNHPASLYFQWQIFATGGEPADGGLGFANPDNLAFDGSGNLWMVTDMSTGSQNKAVASRIKDGKPLSTKDLVGLFGNNTAWFMPTSGSNVGNAYPFAIGPTETECTGPWFTQDQQTLFFSIQHPGEANGIRQNMAFQEREFLMKTSSGQEFMQTRQIPIGSNWPGKQANDPPRPAVVAIRRDNNRAFT